MSLWDVFAWIVMGGVAGWIASIIHKTDASMGTLANIVVGIVGAFVGGFIFNLLGQPGASGSEGFSLYGFLVALVGAVVLLGLIKLVRR